MAYLVMAYIGASFQCDCGNGDRGAQICNDAGSALGPCECVSLPLHRWWITMTPTSALTTTPTEACVYHVNMWSACSQTCGRGVRKRSMDCICRGVAAAPGRCEAAGLQSPAQSEPCSGSECASKYQYQANPWSGCSETCVRTRTLNCILSESGASVPTAKCTETGTSQAFETESCTSTECSDLATPVDWINTGGTPACSGFLLTVLGMFVSWEL